MAGRQFGAALFKIRVGGTRPPDGALHGRARVFVADGILGALVQHHQDVAAKSQLRFDSGLGRELVGVAVQVGLKHHALGGDLAQSAEAEHLESAGIGQDGARPRHETVQPAQGADQVRAGP